MPILIVDVPNVVHEKLTLLARQLELPKAEIIERLVDRQLSELPAAGSQDLVLDIAVTEDDDGLLLAIELRAPNGDSHERVTTLENARSLARSIRSLADAKTNSIVSVFGGLSLTPVGAYVRMACITTEPDGFLLVVPRARARLMANEIDDMADEIEDLERAFSTL